MLRMTFFLLSVRWSCADTVHPPDAGPAAASDEEAAASSSCSPAESRADTRTGHRTAEGKQTNRNCSLCVKYSRSGNIVNRWSDWCNWINCIFVFSSDWHSAGNSAGSPAYPAVTAKGDLCCHHPASTRDQDPVLYYIHRPASENHWSSTNPGTSSLAVTILKQILADK